MKFLLLIIPVINFLSFSSANEVNSNPDSVVYGEDNRREIYSLNSNLKKLANSTFIITQKKRVIKQGDGIVFSYLHYGRTFKLCKEEPFYEQLSSGFCTGFLIAGDLAVTAGHCISEKTCNFVNMVFDYQLSDDGTLPPVFSQDKVFSCKEIIFS